MVSHPGQFVQDLKKHGIVLPEVLHHFSHIRAENSIKTLVKLYHVFLDLVQSGLGIFFFKYKFNF